MKLPFARSRHPLHPETLAKCAMGLFEEKNRLRPATRRGAIGMTLVLIAVALFLIRINRDTGGDTEDAR